MTSPADLRVKPKQFLNVVTSAAVGNGLVDETSFHLARDRGDAKLIVVAAAPRSGSTFLVNTLAKSTGLAGFRLCAAYATNEHDLYLPALCLMNRYGCVSQLHVKGTFHNAALMRVFGIRPIVLVRHIDDIVVSLAYDLRKKAQASDAETGRHGYSFLWPDRSMRDSSEERLLDMVIALAVPWFVNFYVSWYRLCEQGAVDALWVTYEQMLADKEATLRHILDFLGLPAVAIDRKLLERRYDTFRDGRTGCGRALLSAAQRARIRELFSYYPGIDFAKYGL